MVGEKMMSVVHPVNLLVETEYERAALLHGERFANGNEGIGVIVEEVQEAKDELDIMLAAMSQLVRAIRLNKGVEDFADMIRDKAVNCAAECIQVAAMCEKLVRTVGE